MKKILLFLLWVNCSFAVAQDNTFNYWPKTTQAYQIIEYENYVVAYSEVHEQAVWVAYELTKEKASSTLFSRTDNFREDPQVITGSATLADYSKSGFDRGHLAPAGDFRFSHTAISESFYMTNISPQTPGFNRGIWKKLESLVRNWAIENDRLFIITGGVLEDSLATIGVNNVAVPRYFYKVILDYTIPSIKAIAFLMENKSNGLPLDYFAVTIDSVEALTGIDFFPSLEDYLEEQLESTLMLTEWNWESDKDTTLLLVENDVITKTVQCSGIAKSTGNRCKTNTKNKEGYCNHHLYQISE